MTSQKPLGETIVSEVALDGLEGVTFLDLCQRVGKRQQISYPLPNKLRDNIWKFVKESRHFRFYNLPVHRPLLKIYDRATLDALPYTKQEEDQPSGVVKYQYNPIHIKGERGSCSFYDTRVEVSSEQLSEMDVDGMLEQYGQALVIVASQKERNKVLGLRNDDLNLQQYCILERIGRSRELGEFSAGQGSLQDILSTEKKVSGDYVMKRLVIRNLITKQEYRLERENVSKSIFHLPQFYSEMKSRMQLLLENAVIFLKSCPNNMAEIREVRAALMVDEKLGIRVTRNQDFREVTERHDLPYRQVYPDAPREKWQCKNHSERILNMIRLKDPTIEVYNLFARRSTDPNDDEASETLLLDVSNHVFDLSLLRQLYRYLDERGPDGAKQLDVQRHFGLSRLNSRALIRVFEKHGLSNTFVVDEGRQRVTKVYLKKYAGAATRKPGVESLTDPSSSQEILSQTSQMPSGVLSEENEDDVLLNVTDNIVGFEASGVDTSRVEATLVFTKTCPNMKQQHAGIRQLLESNSVTHRVIRRCQIILKLVRLRKVVSTTILNTSIRVSETRLGYKDLCDKKSCTRLLNRLAVDNYLNIMELKMLIKDKEITYLFACDPSIDPDSEEVRTTVDSYKAKQVMKLVFEEEGAKDGAPKTTTESVLDKEAKKGLQEFTLAPKFIRMRNLHEFLFYYMYGQNEDAQPLDAERVVRTWNGLHPDTDMSDLSKDLPPIYSKELDWRTFIAPNRGERFGWGILGEIVYKMPLSLVFTLINFDLRHPELQAMMLHPVKRFYTVAQAPQSIRAVLTYHRTYSYSIYSNALNLVYIGALQFGIRRSPEKDQVYIYVNRKVSVYDTRSSEPAYHKVDPDKDYTLRVFYLKTLDELEKYWSDIYVIAHGTKLNARLASAGQEILIEQPNAKPELQKCTEARSWEEAVALDDGSIPGDHLGAAGFDSALFTHLKQNWMKGRSSKSINTTLLLSTGKKKRGIRKYKMPQVSAAEAATKRKAMIAMRKVGRRGLKSDAKLRKIPLQGKRIRLPHYDEVDKTALKLMNKLRVDWKEEEDQTLLTCKLALLYLNPPVGCGAAFQAIRDILHFKHSTAINKTTKACQRRLMYILKYNMDTRSILNFCVEELKQNADIEKRFGENFLVNLRHVFRSEQEFNVAMKIHFVLLVYLLESCYKNLATNQFQFKNIVLPETLLEFQEQFNLSRINKFAYVEDPITTEGVQTMMVDAVIHSSMCCTKDKTTWNFQLFDIYKNYPDELLRTSIKGLRARSVISANKSVMTKRLFTSAVSGCPFHLSQTYLNQITTKYSYDSFGEAFWRVLDMGHVVGAASGGGLYNFKSFDIGSTLLFADLSNREVMTVNIELPKYVMQVDKNSVVDNTASYERTKNKFRSILEHFKMNDEREKELGDDDSEEEVPKSKEKRGPKRLTFHEIETFNYAQAPVERLLKLDYIYYHFFCLLNALHSKKHQVMSQNFTADDKKCVLDCILSELDPIDACIRTAATCKDMIKTLLSANKKTSATKGDNSLTKNYQIKEENLQLFFKTFIENHKTQNKPKLVKLCGKTTPVARTPNMLDLANDLNLQSETQLHFWIKLTDNTSKTKFNQTSTGSELATSQSIVSAKKSKKDVTQDNVHRYHDLFNINIGKLAVGVKKKSNKKMIDFEQVQAPECLLLLSKEKKEEVVKKIKSSAIWPIHMRNLTELRKTLKAHEMLDHERKLAENVLEQIKDAGELGVKADLLAVIFSNTSKTLLQKVINALVCADFVLRTGIRTITYVHWTCVNNWLVKSYNLKRCERESIPLESLTVNVFPSTSSSTSKRSREIGEDETEFLEGPSLKRPREDYPEPEPVSDFVDRENIFLIPTPWIRINGTLNRRTLDKWMGSLLLHILQFPGQYLNDLFNRFSILTPVQIRKLIEFLMELDCVEMKVKVGPKVTLFSDFSDDFQIQEATDFDSEHQVFVQSRPEAFTKFAIFVGNKKYSSDFI